MAMMACCARCAGVPSAEELSALPPAELAARLAGAYRLITELTSRHAGQPALDPEILDGLITRCRQLATTGLTANIYRRTATAEDVAVTGQGDDQAADRLVDGAANPAVCLTLSRTRSSASPPAPTSIFTNNEAERTIRPVKVQQRSSAGCWRTFAGLADFAIIQSYLSTAAKWGISKLDALRGLFNGHA
jgi:hypothetical protein